MSAQYRQLLDSTILHLENLRAQGVRFVTVDAAALAALTRPASAAAAPAPLAPRPAAPIARAAPPAPAPPVPRAEPSPAVIPALVPSPLAAANPAKAAAMEALRQRALACVKCPNLASSRRNVVFGVGNVEARLMFVGEAPGADEDAQGEPFVGAAGQKLTGIIQAMGLSRQEVYIANILKCRPDTPGQSRGNRKPTPEEMATCIPYLQEQIDLIQPQVLVALGAVAVEGLINKSGISRLRGQWQSYRDIPLMPTFHPSYLLHREGDGEGGAMVEKRKVWEDMMQVMEKLGLPISDKQRRYFLSRTGD